MRTAYYNRSLIPPHNSSLDYTFTRPYAMKMLITRHILSLGYSLIYIDTDVYVYGDLDSALSSLPFMEAYFATDRRCCGIEMIHNCSYVSSYQLMIINETI